MFIPNPNPEKYNIVNHKDKSRTNFNIENLEWCDSEYNVSVKIKKIIFQEQYMKDNQMEKDLLQKNYQQNIIIIGLVQQYQVQYIIIKLIMEVYGNQ